MNRETKKILNFIQQTPSWESRLEVLRKKHSNYKDFFNQIGYLLMELLNTEKAFFDYPRERIEISKIANLYF